MSPVSRRAVLLGSAGAAVAVAAGAVAGVETGVLPGKVRLDTALGRGEVDEALPDVEPGPFAYSQQASEARGKTVTWGVFRPDDRPPAELAVGLFLHGRGASARAAETVLHLERYLPEHVRRGGRPLAVVSVDGDDRYWHPRADGDDPLRMILDELLPRVGDLGLPVDRIATLGYSMGGYGSLLLARESEADRLGGLTVAVAAASSPALFLNGSYSPGSFDDAADWKEWGDLVEHPQVTRTPLHVDCGTTDPFTSATRQYRRRCATTPSGGLSPGRHDGGYWRSVLPAQLDFIGEHLP